MISRSFFIKQINRIVEADKQLDDIWQMGFQLEGPLTENAFDNFIEVLSELFPDPAAAYDWIMYFCFELDFGARYQHGTITDENGNNIVLSCADDLYTFLMSF